MSPGRRLALAAALLLPLAGCEKLFAPGKGPFQGIDVTGGDMGGELRLTDHHGKARSLGDFRGKLAVVSFGYTNCPDVCPTTLADLASAVRKLGADARQVQVIFVSVDPGRDTPELLSQYVPAFHPDFLALTGEEAAIEQVKKDFRVYSAIRQGATPETYTVDHSGQVFVFDRQGRIRLLFPPGMGPEAMARDLRVLLDA